MTKKVHYRFLTLVFFILVLPVWGQSDFSVHLAKLLPPKIAQFKINQSTKSDVLKILGKANLVEDQKHYYEFEGLKYALMLTYQENLLSEIHYTFVKKKPVLEKLAFKLETSEMAPFPSSGSAAGRYFLLSKEEGELMIDPLSKTVTSIRIKK